MSVTLGWEQLHREEAVKLDEYSVHGIGHIPQGRNDRKTVNEPIGFIEHYMAGYVVHLHCRWWIHMRPLEVKEFCFRFHWLFDEGARMGETALAIGGQRDNSPTIQDEYGSVFVDVVETTKDPQRVSGRGRLISLVWLRPLNLCEFIHPQEGLEGPLADTPVGAEVTRTLQIGKLSLRDSSSVSVLVRRASA